ncbi:fructosamine kinase family protein [Flexithrix dorotheae]|uniref:fructosamine kinase family protein n=1 Tax=Flexithrix dorotheae TaxID=70993 RepID=UPI000365D1BD|nr:fructosamine kinase family protein [Flexithrix dorotheae]
MSDLIISLFEKVLKKETGNDVKISSIKLLGGGCINSASRIKTNCGDFFAKWNHQGPADLFIREAESLSELKKANSSLKIPKVIAYSGPQDNYPAFLITEYINQSNESRIIQDEKLGRGLAEIHQFENEKFGFYTNNYCGVTLQNNSWNMDWVDFYSDQKIRYLTNLIYKKGSWGVSELKLIDQFLLRVEKLVSHRPAPSLTHGDLWSGNYLYTMSGPALIDPASYYADREFDLSLATMFGGFSEHFWGAYQEAYPLLPEWKTRNEIYMLYHYLNHFFLFGGGYGNQALSIIKKYL